MKAYILENNLKPTMAQAEEIKQTETPRPTTPPPPPKAKSASAVEQNEVDYEDIELSNMRKVIAKRLLFSKVIICSNHSFITVKHQF